MIESMTCRFKKITINRETNTELTIDPSTVADDKKTWLTELNRLKAPKSGYYSLTVPPLFWDNYTFSRSDITLYTENGQWLGTMAGSANTSNHQASFGSWMGWMNEGNYIQVHIDHYNVRSTVTMDTISDIKFLYLGNDSGGY